MTMGGRGAKEFLVRVETIRMGVTLGLSRTSKEKLLSISRRGRDRVAVVHHNAV